MKVRLTDSELMNAYYRLIGDRDVAIGIGGVMNLVLRHLAPQNHFVGATRDLACHVCHKPVFSDAQE